MYSKETILFSRMFVGKFGAGEWESKSIVCSSSIISSCTKDFWKSYLLVNFALKLFFKNDVYREIWFLWVEKCIVERNKLQFFIKNDVGREILSFLMSQLIWSTGRFIRLPKVNYKFVSRITNVNPNCCAHNFIQDQQHNFIQNHTKKKVNHKVFCPTRTF